MLQFNYFETHFNRNYFKYVINYLLNSKLNSYIGNILGSQEPPNEIPSNVKNSLLYPYDKYFNWQSDKAFIFIFMFSCCPTTTHQMHRLHLIDYFKGPIDQLNLFPFFPPSLILSHSYPSMIGVSLVNLFSSPVGINLHIYRCLCFMMLSGC